MNLCNLLQFTFVTLMYLFYIVTDNCFMGVLKPFSKFFNDDCLCGFTLLLPPRRLCFHLVLFVSLFVRFFVNKITQKLMARF